MWNMTLTQLRYYQAVCQFNSISKASEHLHVSQPAVSIAISNLEMEFHVILLKRDNRTFEITEAGQVFLSLTNDLLANVDSMYNQMKSLQYGRKQMRLSVVPFSFSQVLQSALQKYRDVSPEIKVKVFECNSREAVQKLKAGEIDAALTVDLLDHPSFLSGMRLYTTSCVFVVGKNHPMASHSSCTFLDLAHESLIFTKEDSHLTTQVKKRFQAMDITPNVFLSSAQSKIIESALQSGHDGAIISDSIVSQLQNVSVIPIEDAVEISHLLIWKQTAHLSPVISRFIKVIRSFYPEATPY